MLFNPVVEHWSKEIQEKEDQLKADPSVMMLYFLTGNGEGSFLSFYSLHEAEMGLYDEPERTVIVFDYMHVVPRVERRLQKVYYDLRRRFPTAPIFDNIKDAEKWFVERFL